MLSSLSAYSLLPTAYSPLALSFMSPGFVVAGAALVSIPIIIHILNRRRFKTVTWAAMDFLLKAMRKNRKRLRFEQWLLLATRCLLIFLLAFALARPMMGCSRQNPMSAITGRAGLNVFVIDNSYSAGYEANRVGPGGTPVKTHLDQQKLIAKRLIDGLAAGGESVALIAAARPATAVIARPGYDLNAAKAAIDRLELSAGGTDLAGSLNMALKLAEEDAKAPNKHLYLLTDGTRSAWEGQQSDAIRALGPKLAGHYRITHYNMTQGRQQWNQAALDLRPKNNLVTTKFDTELSGECYGFGDAPAATAYWTLGAQPLGSTNALKLSPSSTPVEQVLQAREIKAGGPHVLTLTVGGDGAPDPLKVDNKRYRVVDVASALRVLIVEGFRDPAEPLGGSGAFLQLALAPPADSPAGIGGPRSNSYVEADLITDSETRDKVLSDYRAIILCGVERFDEQEAQRLEQFVQAGGTLMLFMGEQVNKENYNSMLLPRKLMPGPLVKQVDTGTDGPGFNFDFRPDVEPRPFIGLFRGHENTGLDTAKVFTYWQVDVPPQSGVQRVLNYLPAGANATGAPTASPSPTPAPAAGAAPLDPAFTVHNLGKGTVVFCSTTASPKWTSFPAKMAYVELMHEILSGGVRPGDYWMNLTVGQPLEIPAEVKLAAAPKLADDTGTPILIDAVSEQGKPVFYRSRPLNRPGVYTLDLGNGTVPVAVNVPGDEADVRPVSNENIRKALGDIDMALEADQPPSEAAMSREGSDWAGPALIAVLCLLAVECFMAMSFGHYRRSQAVRAG